MDKFKFENDFVIRLREAVKKYKEKKSKEQ